MEASVRSPQLTMDPQKSSEGKTGAEVVLMIQGEESSAGWRTTGDPKLEVFDDSSSDPNHQKPKSPGPTGNISNEITKSTPSPRKTPRITQTESLVRRRSIAKPKSRFVEQSLPPVPVSTDDGCPPASDRLLASPNPKAPKTPSHAGDDEEEEDDAIYQRQPLASAGTPHPKWKVRVVIEWAILILAMGCLVTSLTVHPLDRVAIWGLEIWKWCLMVAVTCCGRLVTYWLMTFLVFLIERNFLLRKKVLYFVYGLKNSVRICIWLSLVLLTWSLLFSHGVARTPKTVKALSYVTRALVSLLIGSVLWMVKILLVKILASSFHMNTFFDRIQESIFHQYVLQMLSGPPLMEMAEKVGTVKSTSHLSFGSTRKGKGKKAEELGVIDMGKLHNMRHEKVSAWIMRGLMDVIRTSGLSTISNTIENFDEDGSEQIDQEITNEWEAKAAAIRIFKNVATPGHKYIDEEDLLRFLSKEELTYVLPLFEGAVETGRIKQSALRNWVVKAHLDRKSLAHSLNDTKTAVKQLHKLASAVVVMVIVIVTLLLMGFATTKVLVFISSQLLLVVFMFGNTCKTLFEAIIFVFIMHPFDVGDRCVVDGVQMIVEEMNILTTTFLRYDNEMIFYPNAVLLTKPISNFYRSPEMNDSIEFSVDISTSIESIGALKSKVKAYIDSKPNHWQPSHSMVVKEIVNMNKLNMVLNVKHTINYQNIPEKNSRRSDLVLELKKIFEELSIRYHLLPQEVHLSYTGLAPLPVAIGGSMH